MSISTTLADVGMLARALLAADREVLEAELLLKERKERARLLREESLPAAMQELGLTKIVLDSGEQITVKLDVYASISESRKDEAFAWLERHGFGGLIKTKVLAQFGKGEFDRARALAAELNERGEQTTLSQEVHPQTLKAFLREQLEAGSTSLPLDVFGAREVWVASIK